MSDIKPIITIITPTYNRYDNLIRLANSLKQQTNHNFQWLIIDDGSTDDTKKINNREYQKESNLEYHYKINGGKHTALNYSHKFIKGKYVVIVDSDDYLTKDSIAIILHYITKYENNEKIACLSFLRGYNKDTPIEKTFPQKPTISNHIEFRINQNRSGDCCEIIRTEVFKKYIFPEFENEKFMSEGYLWANIAKQYDTVYINKIIYICNYLDGGLTKTGRSLRIKCPMGGMANSNAYLSLKGNRKLKITKRIKQAILYDCYSIFAKQKINSTIRKCNSPLLSLICYPLGIILYKKWKRQYFR